MNLDPTERKLREAILGGDEESLEVGAAERLEIQRAIDGELSAAELDDLLRRALERPELARAWGLARQLRAEIGPGSRPRPRWSSSWLWGSAAAAAAAIVAVTVGVLSSPAPVERAPARPEIRTEIEDSAKLPRDAFRLAWDPVAPQARYRVEVVDEQLELVDRARDLSAPEYTVPAPALERLGRGALLYWRVEALLPDGERVVSSTFVQVLD